MELRLSQTAIVRWWLLCLACLASAIAMPAAAQPSSPFASGSVCHAGVALEESYADIASDPTRWICDQTTPAHEAPRHFVRFDLSGMENPVQDARYLAFFRSTVERIELTLLDDADIALGAEQLGFHDLSVGPERHQGFIELPEVEQAPAALLMELHASTYPEAFADGVFLAEPPVIANAGFVHLLAALICGLLLAPVLFDLGFHRTLRETFPLFHAMFCLVAVIQTASISGLFPILFDLTLKTELLIAQLSFDLMLVATILFVRSFIEPGVISRRHSDMLAAAACIPLLSVLLLIFPEVLPPSWLVPALYGSLAIMLGLLFYVMGVAWKRGSQAIRWVTLAFTPLFSIGILRITGALYPPLYLDFSEMWAQNFALLFEVAVTSFAVADRFLTIKRERDSAVTEARSLETLSVRDALTGLLNRRALADRFDALRAEGFTAMALVDLDHFKSINDTYGHSVGDDVLKAAARALVKQQDEDLLAFRIGGEEFLLLLRGRAMQARAEERRRAVAKVIARETDIEREVTASMGYLEASSGALANATFEALYERVDALLYDAKESGRDRMAAEKVSVFRKRRTDRRANLNAA